MLSFPASQALIHPTAEPDRSNPTRSRWERPLDTIRSFEAAIDGGYSRKSLYRSDSESVANFNRRSSYYSSEHIPHLTPPRPRVHGADALDLDNGGRFPQDGYYGGRSQPASRPEVNQIDMRQGGMSRDSFYDLQQQGGQGGQGGYYNGNGHNGYNGGFSGTPPLAPPGRQRYSRMASEPQLSAHRQPQPDAHVYPIPNNHRSYETVASAAGSGSYGEPAGYQTDPTSSDNSSVERMQPPQKRQPEPVNDYGIGFTQNSTYQPPTFTVGANGTNGAKANGNQANGYQSNGYRGPPPAPPKDNRGSILRKPISQTLSANSNNQERPSVGEKRKSWFARRFSKQT